MPITTCGPGCTMEDRNTDRCCGDPQVSYVGAVLDKYEENGLEDSDFHAAVWDDETQRVTTVCYASTRSWTYHNHAEVDMTPDVEAKALAWYRAQHERFVLNSTRRDAATPQIGDRVRSLTKTGKNKGAEGVVEWIGQDQYSFAARHRNGQPVPKRYGIRVDGEPERRYLSEDKVEMLEPRPVDEDTIRGFSRTACPANWRSALLGVFTDATQLADIHQL